MKLCDAQSVHPASNPARLEYSSSSVSVFLTSSDPRQGDDSSGKFIHNWYDRVATNLRGKLTVRDYDFEKADRPVEAESYGDGEHSHDEKEVYVYPGNLVEEARASHLGEVALESQRAGRQIFTGETQATGIAVGTHLTVFEHPHERKNGEFLITKTYHNIVNETYRSGDNLTGEQFSTKVEAIPVSRPFRPQRTVPRPVTHGLESAIVTGPEGEEIYTDEWGRVKVRFHWDRSGSSGDKSTCWIRVSQTGGLGNLILPRVTHEVLVDFLNGDPDRPIVVGRVFNSRHKPIYKLPEHKTRALWRTKRYGKTGQYPETQDLDTGKPGVNELRFEDKGGSEEVFLHAERDMNTRIRHEETHHVGRNQQVMVGNDREVIVGHNETITIGNDQSRQIAHNQTLDVGDQQRETIGSHRSVSVGRTDTLSVGQTIEITAGTSIKLEAGMSIEFKVGATTISMDNMGINFKGPMLSLKADATVTVQSLKTDITGSAMLTETGGIVMIN